VPEEHLEHEITGKQEEGEHPHHGHRKDAALELLGEDRVEMTDEQASLPIRHGCMAETDMMSRVASSLARLTSLFCRRCAGSTSSRSSTSCADYLCGSGRGILMAADALGLFKELCYVEYSHPEHSPGAGEACGGRRGIHSKPTHLGYSRSCAVWSTRIRALTGSRRGQWRPQGHPNVKIWAGHFLTAPTGVHSRGERAARGQFLCQIPVGDRCRDKPEKPHPPCHTGTD
jgi:hypothetical protein